MTVEEFIERQRDAHPTAALGLLLDLVTLLDEFSDERCSVVSGKIKARLKPTPTALKGVTDLQLAELCSFADKLEASGGSPTGPTIYAMQFDAYLKKLSSETGYSIPEIKKKAREYRARR